MTTTDQILARNNVAVFGALRLITVPELPGGAPPAPAAVPATHDAALAPAEDVGSDASPASGTKLRWLAVLPEFAADGEQGERAAARNEAVDVVLARMGL